MTDMNVTLPVKRETDDVEQNLTDNALKNILPARYVRKDADGNPIEDPTEVFDRVAKNIALAEAAFASEQIIEGMRRGSDEGIQITPAHIKPDHPRREELIAEVFGADVAPGDTVSTRLTPTNVSKVGYQAVIDDLPDDVAEIVNEWYSRYRDLMESLSFMPNSPTLMNAGDELQQLSACFVDSPEDDITDIHETAKEAAEVFQSGGGMGYAFWQLRPYGDAVGSTGGIASGPITFMRTFDQMCETIAQGGARRGAQMGVMRISHPDIIQFIHAKNKDVSLANTLRLNDPDDFTHTSFNDALEEARELIDEEGRVPEHLRNAVEGHLSNFNISVGITDDFMEALENDAEFTFTNPRTGEPHIATAETKELYDRFGLGDYVEVGEELSVPAAKIWDDIINGAHENGEPGVIYLERVNKEHSFDVEEHPEHRILATNPCLTGEMEVTLPAGETARIDALAAEDGPTTVLTRTASGYLKPREATAFQTAENKPVLRITTEAGQELRVTEDHEIQTATGSWVQAKDLNVGDDVVAAGRTAADGGTLSPRTGNDDTSETANLVTLQTATVASIEDDGAEAVYDLSVPGTFNYFASSDGAFGVNVHNCGEQPLEEYEACNLGHINLSTLAAADADYQDFRQFKGAYTSVGIDGLADDLSEEELVAAFLQQAIDFEEFDKRIEYGTRFLDNVVTMSDFPVPEIEEKVSNMRKVGLGIMGLAQLYIQLGLKYGSEPANIAAEYLMTHINHESKAVSHELAKERTPFAEYPNSKFADPTAHQEWFEHHTGEDASDWEGGFPIRNHNTTTIAPTGTTSMIGNTSGGCEPIYNVAYYKNVSDDVQGDEMLVEFDDYFLRTLEENDVDIDVVKEEAQAQMAENEFDGVDGLETVPDAIAELFVVTGDLSGKQHAAVQCACQQGVDSAISKTCNFPNDATKAEMDEVYRYIYDNGGKGVTVYRDGTRSKQVLTTRAQNTEFADDTEAAKELVTQITDVFGGVDAFLEHEDVQAALNTEVSKLLEGLENRPETAGGYAERRSRPHELTGATQRIETGYGKVYVTINEDENGRPFELFANIGHSGGYTNSFTEALAKVISTALRSGVDPREIVDELKGTRSPKVAWDQAEEVNSIPDAIGTALDRHLNGRLDDMPTKQTQLSGASGAAGSQQATPESTESAHRAQNGDGAAAATEQLIEAGEAPECPECGGMNLYYSEGCKTCEDCGWSEC